ncbi:Hypothetical predicted protein, partial [Olea europaea subsp. europaea]
MHDFLCLGKTYHLSQANLDRALDSLLAGACTTAKGPGAVSLDKWPDKNLDVLELVFSTLKNQPCTSVKALSSEQAVKALDYFAVPEKSWPTGLVLHRRAIEEHRRAASKIVKLLRTQVLAESANVMKGPFNREAKEVLFSDSFVLKIARDS